VPGAAKNRRARAAAFDIEAACSGFHLRLEIGQQFIMSRTYDTVLVIGAEKLSSITNWKDRNTCVLFGDGAGAAILQNRENSHGLLTAVMGADGGKGGFAFMPGGGSRCPATQSVAAACIFCAWTARKPFKNAVQAMCRRRRRRCAAAKLTSPNQMRHSASGQPRIIDAVGERLGATPEQLFHQPAQIRQHLGRVRGHRAGRSRRGREKSSAAT
jgi:3-oxoacyl-[acyl-carrier-protein] synthase III